jgi:Zn-dependent protease with chaperone function
MFGGWMFVPLAGVVGMGFALAMGLGRVEPLRAARVAYVVLVVAVFAAIPLGVFWVIGLFVQLPIVGTFIHDYLHVNGVHSTSLSWWGVLLGAWMLTSIWRSIWLVRSHRRMGRTFDNNSEMIIESDDVFAYTMPGRSRSIVLSRGLVSKLTAPEVSVVIAHERAHARLRHDRALLVGQLCVIVLPFMRPLLSRLEFALERIADEAAVTVCGSRQLVARTLASVALGKGGPSGVAGMARTGVSARVLALNVGNRKLSSAADLAISLVVCSTLILGFVQWRYVLAAVMTICTS